MSMFKRGCVVLLVMLASACGGNPLASDCETNNTGTFIASNTSRGTAQRIALNGATIATLGPGSSTPPQTVAAGVPYTLEFFVANTNTYACSASLVTMAQCAGTTRSCAFP